MEPGCELFVGLPAVIASAPMRQVLDQVRRVARTTVSVLICGETGTGKEIVARAIHHYSMRSAKPWVDINCGALPEHLMETELFGHDKGAFSGADAAREGLFELAHQGSHPAGRDRGTGSPHAGQTAARAGRVPVLPPSAGAVRSPWMCGCWRPPTARSTRLSRKAASAPTCSTAWARPIQVPPLRERRDDIVPLAEYFLRQPLPEAGFSPEARPPC